MGVGTLRAQFRAQAIKREINGLISELQHISPAARSSLDIRLPQGLMPASENDGMLGSILMEQFMGAVISDMCSSSANDNALIATISSIDEDWIDAADDYYTDRFNSKDDKTHNNFGHGKGSIALYERPRAKSLFNSLSAKPSDLFSPSSKQSDRLQSQIAALVHEYESLNLRAG
ncbi:MAG: hypothetical protein KTR28_06225 [Micavibrio sp.]|nr:hypothetical protein [Micavibrio sp.]